MAAEIKSNGHDEWIDILKTVLLYVIPFIATIWKLSDVYAKAAKDRLSESLKDAVRDVVNPQLEQINAKMDDMKRVQRQENSELNNKIEAQSREFNKQVIDLMKEIRK